VFSLLVLFSDHINVGSYLSCLGERHAPLFHLNTPILHLYLLSIQFSHCLASSSWFSCISCSELLVLL